MSAEKVSLIDGKIYSKQAFPIYIDTNGYCKRPNRLGRDTFLVYVDLQGIVIPYGGYEFAKYSEELSSSPLWATECTSTSVTDGAACTGSLVDNNSKVTYRWY